MEELLRKSLEVLLAGAQALVAFCSGGDIWLWGICDTHCRLSHHLSNWHLFEHLPKSLNVFSNLDHYCRHHYCAHSPRKENEVPGFTICINIGKELIRELVSSLIFWWISILVYSFPLPLPLPAPPSPLLHSSALAVKTKASCMLNRCSPVELYTPQVLSTCFTIFQRLIPCVHPEHNASDCSIPDRSCRAEMLGKYEECHYV